jgi:YcaO-like protein with predicted kinase domain
MHNEESLLARLTPMARHMGVTRLANITGLDNVGIPVAMAIRPNSRSLSVSQGKGVTVAGARISALMESLEQYHAEHCELPVARASYAELTKTLHVAAVETLPRTATVLDPEQRLLWTRGRRLSDGESIVVPFELVHLDMTLPLPEGSGLFALGSNGLASGVDLAGALSHGLCEVIERDALALFYERSPAEQAARRIVLGSVDDPCCKALIACFEQADIGVAAWDMTSDVGVPAFLCSVGERLWNPLRAVGTARGYGCHPDRAIALRRALTEAAQSRLTRIAGSRDDMQETELSLIQSQESIDHQRAHLAQGAHATHSFRNVPHQACATAEEVLSTVRERLEVAGYDQAVYVDLSRPGGPIVVARCIVPGLEGFPDAPSYVPGPRARALRPAVLA